MITGNEPAMPCAIEFDKKDDFGQWNKSIKTNLGLTIRQQFAAMAMQGILSACNMDAALTTQFIKLTAEESVAMADALIFELNKPQP